MKFSVNQSALNDAISAAIRAVSKKPTHPILASLLVDADIKNQQLNFTGFDLSLAVVVSCQAEVQAGGRITVPAFLFSQIISKLDGEISFELTKNNTANIISGKSSYSVPVMLPDEYPELPTITGEDVTRVELDPEIISQGMRHTLFSASTDETEQVLTGIHLQLTENLIRFIATDGHRCAVYESQKQEQKEEGEQPALTGTHQDCRITIKNTGCSEMLKVLGKAKEPISLTFDHSYLRLAAGSSSIICRRLQGQYPNVLALFPQAFATTIEIDHNQFTTALQRINIVADQRNFIVKCQLDRQQGEIILKADTEGSAGLEMLAAEITDALPESNGEEATPPQELISLFAVNSKYLLAGLSVIESEKVQLKINTELKPIVLQDDGAMKYLIMPVQMRS